MALSKKDWESYKVQQESTIKVGEMSTITNQLILEKIKEELKKFK